MVDEYLDSVKFLRDRHWMRCYAWKADLEYQKERLSKLRRAKNGVSPKVWCNEASEMHWSHSSCWGFMLVQRLSRTSQFTLSASSLEAGWWHVMLTFCIPYKQHVSSTRLLNSPPLLVAITLRAQFLSNTICFPWKPWQQTMQTYLEEEPACSTSLMDRSLPWGSSCHRENGRNHLTRPSELSPLVRKESAIAEQEEEQW